MEVEGVRKYKLKHTTKQIVIPLNLDHLIEIRKELFAKKFIGEDLNGIGYGNLSLRINPDERPFVVTGSQTGHKEDLIDADFSIVESYSFLNFSLVSSGLISPSSESLTHAAIYEIFPQINAVIHIHSEELWTWMLKGSFLRTEQVEYGTREMIDEVIKIYTNQTIDSGSIFAMGGHPGGIISFGKTLTESISIFYNTQNTFLTSLI